MIRGEENEEKDTLAYDCSLGIAVDSLRQEGDHRNHGFQCDDGDLGEGRADDRADPF